MKINTTTMSPTVYCMNCKEKVYLFSTFCQVAQKMKTRIISGGSLSECSCAFCQCPISIGQLVLVLSFSKLDSHAAFGDYGQNFIDMGGKKVLDVLINDKYSVEAFKSLSKEEMADFQQDISDCYDNSLKIFKDTQIRKGMHIVGLKLGERFFKVCMEIEVKGQEVGVIDIMEFHILTTDEYLDLINETKSFEEQGYTRMSRVKDNE